MYYTRGVNDAALSGAPSLGPDPHATGPDDLARLVREDPALEALERLVTHRLGDDPAHDVHHALRVARWTLRLAADEGDADDVPPRLALAAALVHDVIQLPKDAPDRAQASARSAAFAREVLRELRFTPREVSLVADAVEDHSYSRGATPRSLLGRALQDADRLEALGAIGIGRTLTTGVRMGAQPFDPEDPWAERRDLDDHAYTLDHLFTKLLRLPETMQTAAGRAEAARRVAIMERFLDALAHELEAPRPSPGP